MAGSLLFRNSVVLTVRLSSRAEERVYWQGPDAESDYAGANAWRRGQPPTDATRRNNAFTNARVYLDVVASGFIQGSAMPSGSTYNATDRSNDARPKSIGHVDFAQPDVWGDGTLPSSQIWVMLREWIANGKLPSHHDKTLLGGLGGRRGEWSALLASHSSDADGVLLPDFGASGDVAVEVPPTARL